MWNCWLYRKKDAYPVLIKGLGRLEYRGYDSAGLALLNSDGGLNVYKTKGKVKDLDLFVKTKIYRVPWVLLIHDGLLMVSLLPLTHIHIILNQRILLLFTTE